MPPRSGLGKGLDALIPTGQKSTGGEGGIAQANPFALAETDGGALNRGILRSSLQLGVIVPAAR